MKAESDECRPGFWSRLWYMWRGEPIREANNQEIAQLYAAATVEPKLDSSELQKLRRKVDDDRAANLDIGLDDLLRLERAKVACAKDSELQEILAGLMERLEGIRATSPEYRIQQFDPPTNVEPERQRAVACLMLCAIYDHLLFTKVVQRRKTFALARISMAGIGLLVFLWGVLLPLATQFALMWGINCCRDNRAMLGPWLATVASAGIFGSVFSAFRRVSLVGPGSDPSGTGTKISTALLSLTLVPVGGAVFALLHYLLQLSGRSPAHEVATLGLIPRSSADCAQVLVYSFVAGFAERFVPDIIDSINKKAA